jgi:hypothetical protein
MQTETHHSAETEEGVTGSARASGDRETRTATATETHSIPNAARQARWEKNGSRVAPSTSDLREIAKQGAPPYFPPLDRETRTAVDTGCAAFHLNRQPQTLRGWACHEGGPIRPIRINGRLAWPVAELRRVLGIGE